MLIEDDEEVDKYLEQLGDLKTSPEAGIGSVFNSVDRRVGNITDFVVSPSGPTQFEDHRSKKSSNSLSESMISDINEDELPNFMLEKIETKKVGLNNQKTMIPSPSSIQSKKHNRVL